MGGERSQFLETKEGMSARKRTDEDDDAESCHDSSEEETESPLGGILTVYYLIS